MNEPNFNIEIERFLVEIYNAYARGRLDSGTSVGIVKLTVGPKIWESLNKRLERYQRFPDPTPESDRVIAIKTAKVYLDKVTRNPYRVKIEQLERTPN